MGQARTDKVKVFSRDFALAIAVNFLLFISFQMLPSSLPIYAAGIGVPESLLGLITGVTTIATLAARPLAGAAVDRWGRKGFLLAGTAGLLLGALVLMACPPFVALLAIRLLQGLGWGFSTTAASTVASDMLPKERFGEGMGYFGLSISLAVAIGPALGLALIEQAGLRLLAGVGTGVLVVAALLSLAIRHKPFAAAAGGPAKFFEREAAMPAVTMFLMNCTYGAIITYLALAAANRGIGGVAWFFTVFALAALVARPIFGRLVDRRGFGLPTGIGIVLMFMAVVILVFAGSLPVLLLAGILYGLGQGTLQTTLQAKAVLSSPPESAGAANATYLFGFDAGVGAGSIGSGVLVALLGYAGMFAVMALFPIAAFVLFFVGEQRRG